MQSVGVQSSKEGSPDLKQRSSVSDTVDAISYTVSFSRYRKTRELSMLSDFITNNCEKHVTDCYVTLHLRFLGDKPFKYIEDQVNHRPLVNGETLITKQIAFITHIICLEPVFSLITCIGISTFLWNIQVFLVFSKLIMGNKLCLDGDDITRTEKFLADEF